MSGWTRALSITNGRRGTGVQSCVMEHCPVAMMALVALSHPLPQRCDSESGCRNEKNTTRQNLEK